MNYRVILAVFLSAFAGVAWAGETVLDESTFGGGPRVLTGGAYVVTNSVEFKGKEGVGESGLSVAEGAHVQIRIEKGATLACIGGSGTNAVAGGGNGQMPLFNELKTNIVCGINYESMTFGQAEVGAGAGQGGGGGGAGILVPESSSLTVFGGGALDAKGGRGGDGGKGGESAMGAFHVISWVVETGDVIDRNWDALVWSNRFNRADRLTKIIWGKADDDRWQWWCNAQPASGGGGGAGAGGGGAGIGLPGLAGGAGGNGGDTGAVWGGPDKANLSPANGLAGSAASAYQRAGCGTVRLALGSVTVVGGDGGAQGVHGTDNGPEDDQSVMCYGSSGQLETKVDLYMYNGRAGGGGGKGGKGAAFGMGGGGGGGGAGGCSGGLAFNPNNTPPAGWTSKYGDVGSAGADGRAIQPLMPLVGFFVNGTDVGDKSGTGWAYDGKTRVLTLDSAMTYVLSGMATNGEVQVKVAASGATAVLSNAVVFASGRPAVDVTSGASLTVAANQVMKTGGTPEKLRYATNCGGSFCVLVGPFVTVTVKGIPQVTGFTVSNAVETITNVTGTASCRVMAGDDVFVGYTLEEGHFSPSDNPLKYLPIKENRTVDARSIEVLPYIRYRAWVGGKMADCVCSNYTVVTDATAAFENGRWYAVTGTVSRIAIAVGGSAHLILRDGAKLTAKTISDGALAIYGQTENDGVLVVSGTLGTSLTVVGGNVKAGSVTTRVKNVTGQDAYCVTAEVEELKDEKLKVEGLEKYGIEKARAIGAEVCLWLPDGTHHFTLSDGTTTNRYCAVVKGRGVTVKPLGPVGFFVNGVDIGDTGSGDGWNYRDKNLMLSKVGPYVLSGAATNDEVQVRVMWPGATAVLSNAVVFTSGRPAIDVSQNASLQMAGGTSYLAATNRANNAMALSVGQDAVVTVGLAPGADEAESTIGVFNYGSSPAIAGAGSVAVNGGTFFVWSDKQAVDNPGKFTCGADEVLMTGTDPETLRYVTVCDYKPCVLVGPGVTVTVKDIPHVAGFTVSNAVETLTNVTGEASCRVMKGDDIFVGYTVEEGYTSKSDNPLVYAPILTDVTVDKSAISIRSLIIPYRAWNETMRQMEDRACTNYTVVTSATTAFEDGKWYVVTGTVSTANLKVNGSAHLILCDGAKLSAEGDEYASEAGVEVSNGHSLAIYGQSGGTGRLVATGGSRSAGIGGTGAGGDKGVCGTVTIDGGTVTARGGNHAAGIGGGFYGAGGTVTINGGTVTATGSGWGAGIGSGRDRFGGTATINGGTVNANGGSYGGAGIGSGYGGADAVITINGGTVTARDDGPGAGIGDGCDAGGSTVTINDGMVTATSTGGGAGIGGGAGSRGGTVTINDGTVTATGAGFTGAGIGGGNRGNGGVVTINGGTVTAEGGVKAMDIGRGGSSSTDGSLTIDGGSVKAMRVAKDLAKNSKPTNVYCVTAKVEGLKVERLNVEGLGEYGTNDIFAVDGRVYLWLPDETHRFTISEGTTTCRYCAVVKGRGITVEPLAPVGFFVNGTDVGDAGIGDGWTYQEKVLTLGSAKTYVLSGAATNDEVQVHAAASGVTAILSNAVVFTEKDSAFSVSPKTSATLLMAGGMSCLAATNGNSAVHVGSDAELTVGLAPGADEAESTICVFNYGEKAAIGRDEAIAGAESISVSGGTLSVWADERASAVPLTRAADVFCMLAGSTPETAKVVDEYRGEPYVFMTASVAPVTPGKPLGPFTTAEAATNAAKKAVLVPRDDVAAKLGAGSSALGAYCDMFGFVVTGGGESWFAEAELYPEAWTNVIESAQEATRQIPVAAIAALPLNTQTNVTAKGCGVPGFYYSFYSGGAVTNLGAVAAEKGRNVLCGTDEDVEFSGVVKPSAAAGFFTIGVKEAPVVQPSDVSHAPITILK